MSRYAARDRSSHRVPSSVSRVLAFWCSCGHVFSLRIPVNLSNYVRIFGSNIATCISWSQLYRRPYLLPRFCDFFIDTHTRTTLNFYTSNSFRAGSQAFLEGVPFCDETHRLFASLVSSSGIPD